MGAERIDNGGELDLRCSMVLGFLVVVQASVGVRGEGGTIYRMERAASVYRLLLSGLFMVAQITCHFDQID